MSRGQDLVEFALISTLVIFVLVLGVQYALLGQTVLALGQSASTIARYAAVNPGTVSSGKASSLPTAVQNMLSPNLLSNGGADLTVTLTSSPGTAFGDTCTVSLSYSATSEIMLPNPFFGIPLFPTTLIAQDSQLYE
jgi:Flp pilus assembly protein TadG